MVLFVCCIGLTVCEYKTGTDNINMMIIRNKKNYKFGDV